MYCKTSNGQQLYYELTGNKNAGRYLIFLNGISQSTAAWNLMVPAFANNYQIVVCDFIFQGHSDKRGDVRDFDQHAADIHGLLRFLGIDKITLVGISYGSLVAQHYALNYPDTVERLVLLSTFAHKTPYYEAVELAWINTLERGGYPLMFDVMMPLVLGEQYFEKPLIPIDTLKSVRNALNQDPEALKKLMKAAQQRPDYREKLRAIKKPALVIHGEKDILLFTHMGKAVADAIESSRFEVITDAG
ncbi:MAG TPA: alpha/beta hydrolase, partial [Flavobacteriales bacterium]|nr:alpha/beta hydrolase [Flavobacteriales bacterium]